jgi:chemotaxis family two-component system sensor kinase Cph1
MAVRLALTSLEREVRETGAVITYDRLPRVVGDRDRLTSLFRHLIDNALKYRGAEAPQIEIQAQQDQGNWLFSIRDNGIGIDPKYWAGIFAPFRRLHGSEISGVGLGLAICTKILDAHRGTIRIESTVGRGTTFFFTIPAGDAADR